MPKVLDLHLENSELLCVVAKALSSPIRLDILKLVNANNGLIIKDIADMLQIPASSAAMHVKMLYDADLLILEDLPGTRGSSKSCHRRKDVLHIYLHTNNPKMIQLSLVEMPIGAFTSCDILPTCGLSGRDGIIGDEDTVHWFYSPERLNAGIVWSSAGYLEYQFPNKIPKFSNPKKIVFSLEICSEYCGFNEEWKSDITFWVNNMECSTWQSSGDMGQRHGLMTPADDESYLGASQYGFMVVLEINQTGTYINSQKYCNLSIDTLNLMNSHYATFKFGNKADAKFIGGFNVFGKCFGDYGQDIKMMIEY